MNVKLLQASNIFGLVLVLTMNFLANALPIAGKTTGELSDLYPNLFVPAGLTFSIWGLIYLLLLGFVIYQARGLFGNGKAPEAVSRIGWLFVANCLLNSLWILLWHNQYILLSLLVMLGILLTLILIYQKAVIGLEAKTSTEKYLTQLPFQIYLGWICIATIANVTTWLVDLGWSGAPLTEATWAIIAIILGFLVNLLVVLRWKDAFLPLVGVWAFFGIYLKRSQDETQIQSILVVAAIAGALLFLLSIRQMIRK